MKRIVAAKIPFAVKVKEIIGVGDFLCIGITVQGDDISLFIDDDAKALASEQIVEH